LWSLAGCETAPTKVQPPADSASVDAVAADAWALPDTAHGDDAAADALVAETLADAIDSAAADIADSVSADLADASSDQASTVDLGADLAAKDMVAPTCSCGDGKCAPACGESVSACPIDCATCGNGICEPGEGPIACKVDCCGACGDGKCKGYDCGESPETCPGDCGTACGNKSCDKGETPATCAQDCVWQACGNGVCEGGDGGPGACPQDCSASCGDGTCSKGEDFLACPVDCGYCGDGICSDNVSEDGATCPADCQPAECLPGPGTACDDQNACTIDQCAPAGICKHAATLGLCDDGNVCTTGDHCQMGVCQLGNLIDCSDGNPCTADACSPAVGCTHSATKGACDDGNACTLADVCKNGGCTAGASLDCEDGNPCTGHTCNPASGCTLTEADAACTDGDLCTTGDACADGQCVGAGILDCEDGNLCTKDGCAAESGCSTHAAVGPCEDGNACTTGDGCVGGACVPGGFVMCQDDNPCTADGCLAAIGCVHKPASGACNDGNVCTVGDGCAAGACVPGGSMSCDDGNDCTEDSCDAAAGCTATALEASACSDGSVCTTADACAAGACVSGAQQACSDDNPCTLDSCDVQAGCTHAAANGPCDDNNLCTTGDHCAGGACAATVTIDCPDTNPCTDDVCNPASGCGHEPNTGNGCNDGNLCTGDDTCSAGECAGNAAGCDDGNACTTDVCANGTGCAHASVAGACDDGDACTAADTCAGAVCKGGVPVACTDGNACTAGDHCVVGLCVAGVALSCDDGNPCTVESCDTKLGCQYSDNGGAPCGDFGQCAGGQCACAGGFGIQGLHCPPVLSGIALDGATLSQPFAAGVTDYTATVPLGLALGQLTVQAPPGVAVVLSVNGAPIATLAPGQPGVIALKMGQNDWKLTAIHGELSRVYTVSALRLPTVQQAYLKAPNPIAAAQTTTDEGWKGPKGPLALSGATLVVGFPFESCAADGTSCDPASPTTRQSGAVHVFVRQEGEWKHEAYLKAVDSGPKIHFGAAVAIDADVLVVGAPEGGSSDWGLANGVPDHLSTAGAAYVFERRNGTWQPTATLTVPESVAAKTAAGKAVAISGDTIAVGAPGAGAVDVFVRSAGVWQEQAHVTVPAEQCDFGRSVAIAGDTLVVGAPLERSKATGVNGAQGNTSLYGAGAAFVFVRVGGAWVQQAYLKASNTDANDAFGSSVALAGDMAVIGAPGESGNGVDAADNSRPGSGAAYVFREVGTQWVAEAYLKAPFPDTGDLFGSAVAAQGDAIVIGAPGESGNSAGVGGDAQNNALPDSGAAFWFARSAGKWTSLAYLKASNPDADDLFGASVAIAAGTIAVDAIGEASSVGAVSGDPGNNDLPGSGAAYVFSGEACYFSLAAECDDANPCTADSCDAGQSCHHAAIDGASCATGDGVCQSGTCACPPGTAQGDGACWPTLLGLTTSLGVPAYSPLAGRYHLTVPAGADALTVTATAADKVALQLDAGDVSALLVSGVASAPLPLPLGVTDLTVTLAGNGVATPVPLRVTRLGAVPAGYVKASNPGQGDWFGDAVAVDGTRMVVGADGEASCAKTIGGDQTSNGCSRAGAAYVLTRANGAWVQTAYLKSTLTATDGHFGQSVALSGSTVVVAAPWEDGEKGAVYVFVQSAGTWVLQARLVAPNPSASDHFGHDVAISADTLVVGAPYQDGGTTSADGTTVSESGTAYVFTRTGGGWSYKTWLRAAVPGGGARFGAAVAIDGDTIVVGAPLEDGGATTINGDPNDHTGVQSGAVFVFGRFWGMWFQQAYLKTAAGTLQNFGQSVAVSGDTVVAGTGRIDKGAYVFTRQATVWQQQAALAIGGGQSMSVAVSGDRLALGLANDASPWTGILYNPNPPSAYGSPAFEKSGALRVFTRKGGAWSHESYIKAAVAGANDQFGVAVALSGQTLVAGAPMEDSATAANPLDNSVSSSGAVSIFTVGAP